MMSLTHIRRGKSLKSRRVAENAAPSIHHGRWQWTNEFGAVNEDRCPACRRIADRLPAGILTLHGGFVQLHETEIFNLARNQEAAERSEHPLNRIADIERTDAGLVITTTDIHLPRRIGEAIKRAYRGTLDMHFDDAAYFMRADWWPPS